MKILKSILSIILIILAVFLIIGIVIGWFTFLSYLFMLGVNYIINYLNLAIPNLNLIVSMIIVVILSFIGGLLSNK